MKVIYSVFAILILSAVLLGLIMSWDLLSSKLQIFSSVLWGIYFLLLLSPGMHVLRYLYGGAVLLVWNLAFFPQVIAIPLLGGVLFLLFQSTHKMLKSSIGKLVLQALSFIPVLIFQFSNVLLLISLISTHIVLWIVHAHLHFANKATHGEIHTLKQDLISKDRILSTLAHELRTPLTVISTAIRILLEKRAGDINMQQQKFLRSTQENAERMTSLIENILTKIKIEHIWFSMNKKTCDLRPIVKKACKNMEPLISEKKQYIRYSYPNLLSYVMVDAHWIEQVLVNLIHNSSKHLEESGQIIVSVKENEQYVLVSVSDNGLGIRQDDRRKVFSEYYQGTDDSLHTEEGLGLGLSIAKDVVKKHDGKIYLGSVEGLGTTLTFTLPKV